MPWWVLSFALHLIPTVLFYLVVASRGLDVVLIKLPEVAGEELPYLFANKTSPLYTLYIPQLGINFQKYLRVSMWFKKVKYVYGTTLTNSESRQKCEYLKIPQISSIFF